MSQYRTTYRRSNPVAKLLGVGLVAMLGIMVYVAQPFVPRFGLENIPWRESLRDVARAYELPGAIGRIQPAEHVVPPTPPATKASSR